MSSWWEATDIWVDSVDKELVIKFYIPWDENGANYLTVPLHELKKVLDEKK